MHPLILTLSSRRTSPFTSGARAIRLTRLWAGIVFNGEKVGFTHLKIVPLPEQGLFRLESEAHLRIRFLGLNKGISMKSSDRVRADLTSESMRHEIVIDDKTLLIEGTVREGVLRTVVKSGAEVKSEETKLGGPLYPARCDQPLSCDPGHGCRLSIPI